MKLVFLSSGGGGNLRFLCELIRRNLLNNVEVSGVLTDRKCAAEKYALDNNIYVKRIDMNAKEQGSLGNELLELKPDYIVSTINKKIISNITEKYVGRLINLHYSLLPSFGGMIGDRPVLAALEYGSKYLGVTVHYVNDQLDMGKPIVQAVMPVTTNESLDTCMDAVFRLGCISLLNSLKLLSGETFDEKVFSKNYIKVKGRIALVNPLIDSCEYINEEIWSSLLDS